MRDVPIRAEKLRLIACIPLFMLTFVPGACAGDIAEAAVRGFSADGAYFSFEEYGRQDGSGFAYANIYVIDTATDRWVPDSPKRVLIRDETASIKDARAEAQREARFLSHRYRTDIAGHLVASQRITHLNADPHRVTVNPRPVLPAIDAAVMFTIDTFEAQAQPYCAGIGYGGTRGFRLTTQIEGRPETLLVLHEDSTTVPNNRSCPLDYRIHDIVTFFPNGADPVVAILIQVIGAGFEGPDGRFLAVTGPLRR